MESISADPSVKDANNTNSNDKSSSLNEQTPHTDEEVLESPSIKLPTSTETVYESFEKIKASAIAATPDLYTKSLMVATIAETLNLHDYLQEVMKKIVNHFIAGKPTVQFVRAALLSRLSVPKMDKEFESAARSICENAKFDLERSLIILKQCSGACEKLNEKFTKIADAIRSKKSDEEILLDISNVLI